MIEIRLIGDSTTDLDAAEAALRRVLIIPGAEGTDYPSSRRRRDRQGDPRILRYLTADGVRARSEVDR